MRSLCDIHQIAVIYDLCSLLFVCYTSIKENLPKKEGGNTYKMQKELTETHFRIKIPYCKSEISKAMKTRVIFPVSYARKT